MLKKTFQILLFDDSTTYLQPMSDALKNGGLYAHIERVSTLAELQNAFRVGVWDAIIGAYSLSREAAQITETKIPVIVLCETENEDDAFALLDAGFSGVLSIERVKRLPALLRREIKRQALQVQAKEAIETAERVQYEAALKRSETRFRAVIEGFNDIVLLADTYQIIRYTNPAFNSMLGYQTADVAGRPFGAFLPSDEQQIIEQRFANILLSLGSTQTIEHQMRRADNQVEIVETTAQSITDALGQPMLVLHIHSITKRRQDDEILARYAKRLEILREIDLGLIAGGSIESLVEITLKHIRTIIPCQRANVGLIDPATNEGLIFAVDFDGNTELGKGLRVSLPPDFFEGYDERHLKIMEDFHPLAESNPRIKQALKEGLVSGMNVLLMDQDQPIGTLGLFANTLDFFTFEYQDIATEIANQLALAIRQFHLSQELENRRMEAEQHVAELKMTSETLRRSEARYRSVIEDQTDLICRYDGALNLTFVNRAYSDAYGFSPQDMLGTNILGRIPVEYREQALAHVKLLTAANPVANSEHQSMMPDGTQRWFQWTDRALFDEAGNIVEYQGVGRDVTDRKNLELEQVRHTQMVEGIQQFLQATLDSFPANTAVLDPDGVIININAPWKRFADENRATTVTYYVGENYLHVCDAAAARKSKEAAPVAQGIREVIAGKSDDFYIEYPCHSPTEKRWFGLRVTPFNEPTPRRVVVAHINITERKQAEDALQESHNTLEQRVKQRTAELQLAKERVEAILNNSVDGIVLLNSDLYIQQTNSAINRLFTCEPDDYFETSLLDLVHPDDRIVLRELIQTGGSEQVGKTIELRAQRKDGTHFDAELSIGFIKREGCVCAFRDVTERKRAELAVAEERNLLRTLIDTIPDFIYIKDTQHRFILSNLTHAQARGKSSPSELIGMTDFDLFPPHLAEQFRKEEETIFHTGEPLLDHEQASMGYKGGFQWASSNKVPLRNLAGELIGLVGITRDISERKAQERELRFHASVQKSLSDSVIVTDMEFHIQSWNQAAERIYGWRSDEVVGKATADILRTEFSSTEEHDRSVQQLRQQGWWQGEVIQYHKDGNILHVLGSVTLVKDTNGVPYSIVSVNHDISERKRAEEALKASAAEIHDLYNNAPCGYHSLDKDGVIVQINDTELNWLGYKRDEVVGKLRITDIVTLESALTIQKQFPFFKERGKISDLELDLVRKDSSTIHVLLNGTAVYDPDGEYLQSRSILFDITELRQAQRAIFESEARYRLLAENVTDLIAKINPEGIRTFVTPSCYALLGYLPEELIGRPGFEIVHPDDVSITQSTMQQAIASSKTTFSLTQRVQHKQGHYIWVEGTFSIVRDSDSGKLVEIIGVIRDFTERKQAEESLRESEMRYRLLAENITDVIVRVTPSGTYLYASPSCKAVMGYEPHEIVGKSLLDFIHPDDVEMVRQRRQESLEQGSVVPLTYRFRHQEGHYLWLEVVRQLIRSPETGEVEEYIASARDVTDRKLAEDALKQNERLLRMILDSLPVGVSMIDINGNITLGNPAGQQIWAGTKYIGIDQFGEYKGWRVDTGKSIEQEGWAAARAVSKGETTLNEEIEIEAYPRLLRQIATNLISNAIKYSPPDKAVTVSLTQQEHDYILCVQDQGIGIPEADLARLFSEFQRASNVGLVQGTGLGLAIVKQAINLHGGSVQLESQQDKGTLITVTIPILSQV